jgi:hypothetical protein
MFIWPSRYGADGAAMSDFHRFVLGLIAIIALGFAWVEMDAGQRERTAAYNAAKLKADCAK